jgi:hypothetical protein
MKPRTLRSSLALFLVTVMAGLAVRMAPLGLPAVVVKYGGSMLWAVMIYWIVSSALPRWRLPVVGLAAGAIATAVEFFKLYHSPGMDAFRLTLPGMILCWGGTFPYGTSWRTGLPSALRRGWMGAFDDSNARVFGRRRRCRRLGPR